MSNTDFLMQNRMLKDKPNILVYRIGFPMPIFAVSPVEINVFMIIIFNHVIFGSTGSVTRWKRQIVGTFLLSKILGDTSTCAR
jgi:hypothetical protein